MLLRLACHGFFAGEKVESSQKQGFYAWGQTWLDGNNKQNQKVKVLISEC